MPNSKSDILLKTEQSNYLIVYKNNANHLENILSSNRMERYKEAVRQDTKDKLLLGSYFIYRCLKLLGFDEAFCQEAFSVGSSYLLQLPHGNLSYSNSGDYHVLSYSLNGQTGVDIEEYKDRNQATYNKFLDLSEDGEMGSKLNFYKKWLEKEILFKNSQADEISYFMLNQYLCGYGFNSQKDVKVIQLLDLMTDEFEELTSLNRK